mgnify:CR=1 FL=1
MVITVTIIKTHLKYEKGIYHQTAQCCLARRVTAPDICPFVILKLAVLNGSFLPVPLGFIEVGLESNFIRFVGWDIIHPAETLIGGRASVNRQIGRPVGYEATQTKELELI